MKFLIASTLLLGFGPGSANETPEIAPPPGKLGSAIGTFLTIEGVRAEKGKVGTQTLLVEVVNGNKLDEPVALWIDNAELPSGARCVFKGYESGRWIGIPEPVARETGLQSTAEWQFYRYFIATTVVTPARLPLKYTAGGTAAPAREQPQAGDRNNLDKVAWRNLRLSISGPGGRAVDLKPTLERIAAGRSFPHRNDGSVFGNREGKLPRRGEGYYREFVHPTTGVDGPGAQRVVIGREGEIWYTPDHYTTFIGIHKR